MNGLILPCLQADSKCILLNFCLLLQYSKIDDFRNLDSVRNIWDSANTTNVLQSFSIHLYGNEKPIIVSDIFSAIGEPASIYDPEG